MLGLNYASSDDEEEQGNDVQTSEKLNGEQSENTEAAQNIGQDKVISNGAATRTQTIEPTTKTDAQDVVVMLPDPQPEPGTVGSSPQKGDETVNNLSSSFTNPREAIQNLTMPPYPNFDIPPSPPGSPPATATKKFDQFLKLKSQGVHFNEKLAKSSQLRNPGLFQKLCEFAGIDDREQYADALPLDLCLPTAFPPWAYGEQLNKKQADLQKRRDEGKKGSRREFVSATASTSGGSRSSTPGRPSKVAKLSTAEKVMGGGQSPSLPPGQ